MTAVSTLRDDLTFIVSVSLRKYDIFSKTRTSPILFQPFFPSASFYKKSKNSCRFKNFQEYARFCEHLGYSRRFLNLHGLLGFLVKACRYWPLEYSRISMKFQAYS